MKSMIYNLLDAVEIPNKDVITALDLVSSSSRGKEFGRACQKFSGFVAHSEQNASFSMLAKVKDIDIDALQKQAKTEAPAEEPSVEEQAAGLLSRGLMSDCDYGVNLLDKFEAVRSTDKTIIANLGEPMSDLAWSMVGWEDKQNIAASYAVFFMRK